jgi:N-acetylglutamate synthase-like GNAT family acetyltransferase
MGLTWIQESPPYWDADKARIVGGAGKGIFDASLTDHELGALLPDAWWRVEADGKTVGYGWMDITWGDAEILLAVDPAARGRGVGSFILERLEAEARERGLYYIYNVVSDTHPLHGEVTQWLEERSFSASEDGKLLRAVVQPAAAQGFG